MGSRLLRTVAAAFAAPGAPAPGEHVLAAVSGGPDSTALLAALAELAPGRRVGLTVAHVDHGLRSPAEHAAEAALVRDLAARLGVPCVVRAISVDPGAGLEVRARAARYRALAGLATAAGASRIATGHTRDDQVETLLLRLLRGAGRRGLGGMRPIRGKLWRPLLGATRADVRRFLAERELPAVIDRTNADLSRARSRIRRLLVPFLEAEFNPRLGPALAALADRLRDEDTFLEAAAVTRAAAFVSAAGLAVEVAGEPPALARRITRAWLEAGSRRGVTASHVERVLALAAGTAVGAVALPGPARVLRERDLLVRRPGRQASPAGFALSIEPGGAVEHPGGAWRLVLSTPRASNGPGERPRDLGRALFDADAVPPGLVVRSPRPGDRMRLLGGGTRKLQDVLMDAKVPREERPAVPLLVTQGGEVLWVAGVARGAGAPLGPGTTRVLEGTLERAR
jgi:tRNA(Ile)-lysidine synthase